MLVRGTRQWPLPSTSLGAPRSSARSTTSSPRSTPGRCDGRRGCRRARHRKDAASRRSSRAAPTHGGHLVLSGSASELRTRPALRGVRRLRSTSTSRAWSATVSTALDDDVRNGLAKCLPLALSASQRARERRFDTSGTAATAPSARLLERLTGTRPLVLVLDDVHWADSASVELLGSLLRRPPDAAVLVVIALSAAPSAGAAGCSARAGPSCRHPRST